MTNRKPGDAVSWAAMLQAFRKAGAL